MTKEEIRTVVELFISWNDEDAPIDTSNLDSAVDYINECFKPSLPSNLDEAAKEYLKQYNESEFGNGGDDWDDDILITFKAGAEWMEKQEEEYSPWSSINDLEEASISFGEQADMYKIGGQSFSEDMAVAFTRGAEWMAGQGDTREVEVKEDAGGYPYIQSIELYDYDNDEPLFKPGDKVVVQIRKK